ncbi:hypothetical protein EPUS_09107 [Endocarpon pusillum Z07020]|uniref:Uncharacterized protein n=1 Tax=Endocarpon pusillum (strain Z07020 / HMAS-L-300199) TaxID=1263415 RepID=U1HMM5_ENDPU|nr:uncharacterized protein EPUS_09107 [Endocarpon pusillum Z07020]ERF70269.1 hypothetical protein EPUS_09107 [Endocarpon pusillum Z07020]
MDAFNNDFKNMLDTFTTELNATMESLRRLQGTSETMQSAPPALKSSHLSQVMEEFKEAEASMKRQVNDLAANVCSGLQSVENASKKMEDEKPQSLEQRCKQDVESAKQETVRCQATHEKTVEDQSERVHDLEYPLAVAAVEAEEAKAASAKLQTDLATKVDELQYARHEAEMAKSDAAELRVQVNDARAMVDQVRQDEAGKSASRIVDLENQVESLHSAAAEAEKVKSDAAKLQAEVDASPANFEQAQRDGAANAASKIAHLERQLASAKREHADASKCSADRIKLLQDGVQRFAFELEPLQREGMGPFAEQVQTLQEVSQSLASEAEKVAPMLAQVENFTSSLEDLRAARVAYQQETAKAAKFAADAEELQRNFKARSDASANHQKEVADELQQRQNKLEEAERAFAAQQSVEGIITFQMDHTAKRLEGRFDATERAIHLLHPAVMGAKGATAVVDKEIGDLRVETSESFRILFDRFGSVQDSVEKSFACVDDTQQQLLVVKANTEESNTDLRRLIRQLETSGKVTVQSSRKRSSVEDIEAGPSKRPQLVQIESSALVPANITADESTLVEHTHGELLDESVAARPAAREAAEANLAPDTQRELSAEDGDIAGIRSMIEFPAAWTNERSSDCWSALVEKTGSVPELLKLLERAASGNQRAKPGPATCLMEIGNKSGFVTVGDGLRRGNCPVHSRPDSIGFCLYIERAPGTGRVTEVAVGTTSWLVRERPE